MTVETSHTPSENPVDPARAEVEALLAGVPFRDPVVDEYDPLVHDIRPGESYDQTLGRIQAYDDTNIAHATKIDRQWLAVTEAARRGILGSSDVRHAASQLVREPLSEELPKRAIREIAGVDARTARVARAMGRTLGKVLELEPVPDEFISPDIRHAPALVRKETIVDSLARLKRDNDEYFDGMLGEAKKNVSERPGITEAERKLVARRYRYARDVKMLGLMAELYDQPTEAAVAENGTMSHELPSGTKLVMTAEAFDAAPSLLNPGKWESRIQLKDRVYEVTVAGKQYIMKERKTPRHIDVQKHGHRDGLTSAEEFAVAREFAGLGTIRHGDVELRWEQPLGYVEFPDGYQFCMFEAEPDLKTDSPIHQLEYEILASAGEYAEEFACTQQRAKEIYDERKDLLRGIDARDVVAKPIRFAFSRAARRRKKAYEDLPKPDELTFEEFAKLKSSYVVGEAIELLRQTMLDLGYTNSDMDGHAFHLHKGARPTLEIIGFDFEYYAKTPQSVEHIKRMRQSANESGESAKMQAYNYADTRAIVLAASYGMMERMGWKMPPQEVE